MKKKIEQDIENLKLTQGIEYLVWVKAYLSQNQLIVQEKSIRSYLSNKFRPDISMERRIENLKKNLYQLFIQLTHLIYKTYFRKQTIILGKHLEIQANTQNIIVKCYPKLKEIPKGKAQHFQQIKFTQNDEFGCILKKLYKGYFDNILAYKVLSANQIRLEMIQDCIERVKNSQSPTSQIAKEILKQLESSYLFQTYSTSCKIYRQIFNLHPKPQYQKFYNFFPQLKEYLQKINIRPPIQLNKREFISNSESESQIKIQVTQQLLSQSIIPSKALLVILEAKMIVVDKYSYGIIQFFWFKLEDIVHQYQIQQSIHEGKVLISLCSYFVPDQFPKTIDQIMSRVNNLLILRIMLKQFKEQLKQLQIDDAQIKNKLSEIYKKRTNHYLDAYKQAWSNEN